MSGPRHNRVSSREEWDHLVADVNTWAVERGRSAALWRSADRWTVRIVGGADALTPDRLWVCIYSQPAGAAAVPGQSEAAWFIYEHGRMQYEAAMGRRDRAPVESETDVTVHGVRHPHNPWEREPGQRKRRSDAGVSKGPRHLQPRRDRKDEQ